MAFFHEGLGPFKNFKLESFFFVRYLWYFDKGFRNGDPFEKELQPHNFSSGDLNASLRLNNYPTSKYDSFFGR